MHYRDKGKMHRAKAKLCHVGAVIIVACVVFGSPTRANANSITGDISLVGQSYSKKTSPGTMFRNLSISSQTGTFGAFITPSQSVSMTAPWNFTSSTPFSYAFSIGGFTFDLNSGTIVSQTKKSLQLTGSGTVTSNGFTTTVGDWTALFIGKNMKHFELNFTALPVESPSIPPVVASVPEDGSSALFLVFGLAPLVYLARRRQLSPRLPFVVP